MTARPCVAYVRVSTDRQAGEAQTSLADQERAISGLATTLGLTVERWYRDEGASGATVEKRPALRQLIADCEANPRDERRPGFVLVLNDSRWGRFPNPEDSAYWRRHVGRIGWVVRFVENDDTQNPQLRTVMRAIVATQATQKREDVRANARRGSRGTASQGYWGAKEPYGYRRAVVFPVGRERVLAPRQRKAPDEKVRLVRHAPEAGIVRALFDRYATGTESIASLTAWLRQIAPERKWTRAAVKFTLSNPAYLGDVVSGRYSPEERARHPESDWIVAHGAHEAIVPLAVYAACQEMLRRNARWTTRVRADWIVSGLVRCPCGQPYVAGGSNKNARRQATRSYRCVTKAGLVADRCPYPGTIKKEWLEDTIVETVARIVGGPSQRARLRAILDAVIAEARSASPDALAGILASLRDATATRDRLVQAVADGTLTADEARTRLDDVRRRIARLEGQRDALSPANAAELEAERDQVMALALDFREAARTLRGPALRERLRPWIHSATFDPTTRRLHLAIRHVPVAYGGLASMAWPATQNDSDTGHLTRRVVTVGGRR